MIKRNTCVSTEGFYRRIEDLLKERGWSVLVLVDKSQIPRNTLYRMIRQKEDPRLSQIIKIADAFQIDVAKLLAPDGEEE